MASVPAAVLPADGAVREAKSYAPLRITLPVIQMPGTAIDWAAKPNLLSPKTRSISGSIGSRTFGPISLAPSEKGCTPTTAGLACTIAVRAGVGQEQVLRFKTFASRNGSGRPLATSASALNIYASHVNYATPTVYGVARQIVAQPQVKGLRQGRWAVVPILVHGVDAAMQTIPSYLVSANGRAIDSVTIDFSGFSVGTLTGACCGVITATFAYAGTSVGIETFSAEANGLKPYATKLRARPGSTAAATLIASTTSGSPAYAAEFGYVIQFASDATGNVPPARTFIPNPASTATPAPFGEDAAGNFWLASTHYSNTGQMLGTVRLSSNTDPIARDAVGNIYALSQSQQQPCAVLEYPANKYGSLAPIREIDYSGCSSVPSAIAVDGNGDVFVSVGNGAEQPLIYEYAPTGSGTLAPIRTIERGLGSDTIQALDTDAAGNLYAMYDPYSNFPTGPQLFKFVPGSAVGTQLLVGEFIESFAADDAGDICVGTYFETQGTQGIQCFSAGSYASSQLITGQLTLIYHVWSIALPRSS